MPQQTTKGRCAACGKEPRVLTQIASGQGLCRTCLKEIRPPRPKHLATLQQIKRLRERGINVIDDITKEDVKRFNKILRLRELGLDVSDNATDEEIAAAKAARPRTFVTTVAGVEHDNDDGTSRHKTIKRCRQGEMLSLEREPRNRFDPNAIRVLRGSGEQLGYLTARVAGGMMTEGMAEYLDKGGEYKVVIKGITGGGLFGGELEVKIEITHYPFRY